MDDTDKELIQLIYFDSIAQLLGLCIVLYGLTITFWGDNAFRLVLLYMELSVGFFSLFTGLIVSCYGVNLWLAYYGRLNGQTSELIFKVLMCFFGSVLSCYYIGLIWDWLASTYYVVIDPPVDMRWFFWEFFVAYNYIQNQVDTIGDIHNIVKQKSPHINIPQIGQLALAYGILNEVQISHIEKQQYAWKKRAFQKLIMDYSKKKLRDADAKKRKM